MFPQDFLFLGRRLRFWNSKRLLSGLPRTPILIGQLGLILVIRKEDLRRFWHWL